MPALAATLSRQSRCDRSEDMDGAEGFCRLQRECSRPARASGLAVLAERWQTHLVAIFVPALPGATGLIGGTLTGMLRLHAPRWRMRGCGLFERLVANRGFTHEWRVAEFVFGSVARTMPEHAPFPILPSR